MEESLVMQRKIIGLLMRGAREKWRRSVKEVGQLLGVSGARVWQYELGEREVSLPELEMLALYYRIPLSYFLNLESNIEEEFAPPQHPDKMKSMRAMISERLKQARTAAGKSPEECAQAAQIELSMFSGYELGLTDIPITELDRLASFLGVDIFYFLQNDSGEGSDLIDLEKLASMPKDVRTFALNPENLPYLRMAQKLRDLPQEKLKELGEIFLVSK